MCFYQFYQFLYVLLCLYVYNLCIFLPLWHNKWIISNSSRTLWVIHWFTLAYPRRKRRGQKTFSLWPWTLTYDMNYGHHLNRVKMNLEPSCQISRSRKGHFAWQVTARTHTLYTAQTTAIKRGDKTRQPVINFFHESDIRLVQLVIRGQSSHVNLYIKRTPTAST